jgi:hypothetical protein
MAWEIEYTYQFGEWYEDLGENDQAAVDAVVELLGEKGPQLKRPAVGEITGRRIKHLKELRIGTIRVLFAFDPRSVAILLIGGNKTGEWKRWYERSLPQAEDLYDTHLQELRDEGLIE